MIKKFIKNLFIDPALKSDIKSLKDIALFQGLNDRALAKIALIVFKKTYSAGEEIYKPGHEANAVYIINAGEVKITNGESDRVLDSGDFFGEISLLENKRHDSSAKAVKNCEIYMIYRSKFNELTESDLKIGFKIMKNLSGIFATRLKCTEM